MDLLSDPKIAGAAIGVVIVLLVVLKKLGGGSKGSYGSKDTAKTRGADKLIKQGDMAGAGRLAMEQKNWEEAVDFFMRAERPNNAAAAAARAGNYRQAAELYEWGGKPDKAAHYYEKAGMPDKAAEVVSPKINQVVGGNKAKAIKATEIAETPAARAAEAESKFRKAQATAGSSPTDQGRVQELAVEAADAMLTSGDIRRAADIYRDADMIDEAIHLYVNVLGSPGDAAPLLAARGNHERAAELYELAGEMQRAAATWVRVARDSQQPENYIERIVRLNEDVGYKFVYEEAKQRPMSDESADWHYYLATLAKERGEAQAADKIMNMLEQTIGDFREVEQRIQGLRNEAARITRQLGKAQPGGENVTTTTLSEDQLESLANQVAAAAADQLRRASADAMSQLMAAPREMDAAKRKATRYGGNVPDPVAGIEGQPVSRSLLEDAAVEAARIGPGVDVLKFYIEDRECSLQNIEVFYRLGLAYLADGKWDEARGAFEAVEDTSPGYRDAWKRIDEIDGWKNAMGSRLTLMGAEKRNAPSPQTESRYSIEGELGRGGMAVVYRAVDRVLGREVALKFLSEEFASDDDMREMFEREARAVAALNHANIVTIYDFGMLEGRAFICMEKVDGKAVEDLIEDTPLTIVESLRIVRQGLTALEYAHNRNIVHRDIKPANMMRSNDGVVKVMDFGLAKSLDKGHKSSFIAGTPAYMPPEQLIGDNIGPQADIFAMGVTLYELLTNDLPFAGLDRQTPARPMTDIIPSIPEVLDQAVARAIHFDPAQRFASAAEFAQPLDQILAAVNQHAAKSGGAHPGDGSGGGPGGGPKATAKVSAAKSTAVL